MVLGLPTKPDRKELIMQSVTLNVVVFARELVANGNAVPDPSLVDHLSPLLPQLKKYNLTREEWELGQKLASEAKRFGISVMQAVQRYESFMKAISSPKRDSKGNSTYSLEVFANAKV
jgi:hypothetical protein